MSDTHFITDRQIYEQVIQEAVSACPPVQAEAGIVAPGTGLPSLSTTRTVRSALRYFSIRSAAALRQGASGSWPGYVIRVHGTWATSILVPRFTMLMPPISIV